MRFFTSAQSFGNQFYIYTTVDAINDKNILLFRVN